MSLNVCPAAVVAAPVEVVWGALAAPRRWGEWIDGRVVSVIPRGSVAVGQVIALGANWAASGTPSSPSSWWTSRRASSARGACVAVFMTATI